MDPFVVETSKGFEVGVSFEEKEEYEEDEEITTDNDNDDDNDDLSLNMDIDNFTFDQEYLNQIPDICSTLMQDMYDAEWTENEYQVMYSVCQRHVKLETFLMNIEYHFKKFILLNNKKKSSSSSSSSKSKSTSLQSLLSSLSIQTNDDTDDYLKQYIQLVFKEVGAEIRARASSGMANAFDIGMNNKLGLIALIKSIELYEEENETDGKTMPVSKSSTLLQLKLQHTKMKSTAIQQLYESLQIRGFSIFCDVTETEYDENDGDEHRMYDMRFSALLRACFSMTYDTQLIQKEGIVSYFPPNWHLMPLWFTIIARISLQQMSNFIGFDDTEYGDSISNLSIGQLLEFVAGIEYFIDSVSEAVPNLHTFQRTDDDNNDDDARYDIVESSPNFFVKESHNDTNVDGDDDDHNIIIDLNKIYNTVSYCVDELWKIRDSLQDDFLFRSKEQTDELFSNIYLNDFSIRPTLEGYLLTSLSDDVYTSCNNHLQTIRIKLTRPSETMGFPTSILFLNLFSKQLTSRDMFLLNFESCCAATNDFLRIYKYCDEDILSNLILNCRLSARTAEMLDEQVYKLLTLYYNDAIYSCQRIHLYIFERVEEEVFSKLFTSDWLHGSYTTNIINTNTGADNEGTKKMVSIIDHFMVDILRYIEDDRMIIKTIEGIITSSIIFYIRAITQMSIKCRGVEELKKMLTWKLFSTIKKNVPSSATSLWTNKNTTTTASNDDADSTENGSSPHRRRRLLLLEKFLNRMKDDIQTIREYFENFIDTAMNNDNDDTGDDGNNDDEDDDDNDDGDENKSNKVRNVSLDKTYIDMKFEILDTMHDMLSTFVIISSGGISGDSLTTNDMLEGEKKNQEKIKNIILVLFKHIKNMKITKNLVNDLWYLLIINSTSTVMKTDDDDKKQQQERDRKIISSINKIIDSITEKELKQSLKELTNDEDDDDGDDNDDEEETTPMTNVFPPNHHTVPGLQLDQVLAHVYMNTY